MAHLAARLLNFPLILLGVALMRMSALALAAGFILAVPAMAGDAAKYTIKQASSRAPKEVSEPIRKLLSDKSIQFMSGDGNSIGEIWLRKEVPVKAIPEQ